MKGCHQIIEKRRMDRGGVDLYHHQDSWANYLLKIKFPLFTFGRKERGLFYSISQNTPQLAEVPKLA